MAIHQSIKPAKTCVTVGELRAAIKDVPDDTLLSSGLDEGVSTVLMVNKANELDRYFGINGTNELSFDQWMVVLRSKIVAKGDSELDLNQIKCEELYDDGMSVRKAIRELYW